VEKQQLTDSSSKQKYISLSHLLEIKIIMGNGEHQYLSLENFFFHFWGSGVGQSCQLKEC
jgi:hypothetical protein